MEAVVPPLFTVTVSGPPRVFVEYKMATLNAVPLAIWVACIKVLVWVSVTVGAVPFPTPQTTMRLFPRIVLPVNASTRLATEPDELLPVFCTIPGIAGNTVACKLEADDCPTATEYGFTA